MPQFILFVNKITFLLLKTYTP